MGSAVAYFLFDVLRVDECNKTVCVCVTLWGSRVRLGDPGCPLIGLLFN